MSADFERALAFVLIQEGGWSDHRADPGGPTMHGITLSVYTAWRQAHGYAPPSVGALKEISAEEVSDIYWFNYWQAAGCEMLEWPLSLVVFDTAVLHGVGRAQTWLQDAPNDPHEIMARRLRSYTVSNNWTTFGRGWVRRVAALLEEMG